MTEQRDLESVQAEAALDHARTRAAEIKALIDSVPMREGDRVLMDAERLARARAGAEWGDFNSSGRGSYIQQAQRDIANTPREQFKLPFARVNDVLREELAKAVPVMSSEPVGVQLAKGDADVAAADAERARRRCAAVTSDNCRMPYSPPAVEDARESLALDDAAIARLAKRVAVRFLSEAFSLLDEASASKMDWRLRSAVELSHACVRAAADADLLGDKALVARKPR